mmetsp:Transcript_83476/g.217423  ORF Transcript_83476/g.217423 Transcript_83476/m.217423 type:complete len:174 (+) Transcript_83476:77-598(+)|eukprot:CAMPEP_0115205902 /NCGR_PEP_ID=MMETSP0270-20121206/19924_1 /TAXON_ID=71861 /ORGANISM="Scrippsiella trochoidea, Strain CCMP3099" /LENGTH=173 /DNA_ID=CAMNT_0002619447 /DNA_START=77 /DNA_END=598 /DNA_ORIENTATION=+
MPLPSLLLVTVAAVATLLPRFTAAARLAAACDDTADADLGQLGQPCLGGGLLGHGTCPMLRVQDEFGEIFELNMRCYDNADNARKAASGTNGTCYVAHQKRCVQSVPGNEACGGCRGNTVCRRFSYDKFAGGGFITAHRESYCINPSDQKDRELHFLGQLVHLVFEHTSTNSR